MVPSGLVPDCRLASWPHSRSPLLLSNATTDGVVRSPSELVITSGFPPSKTPTQLLVVPRSIPMLLLIYLSSQGDWIALLNLLAKREQYCWYCKNAPKWKAFGSF